MQIVVCLKPVLDFVDGEITISGGRIDPTDCPYSLNEWDAYALEEAVLLAEAHGGSVTAIAAGGEECEEVLRRALALRAERAVRVTTKEDALGLTTARRLASAIGQISFNLVLTGTQASDTEGGQTGGMLAALLGIPFASLVVGVERRENALLIRREIEGGKREIYEIDMPCVLSIQTGINRPRYVSIRGIRRAARQEIAVLSPETPDEEPRIRLLEHAFPIREGSARMLRGSMEDIAAQIADLIRREGGNR